MVAEKLPERAGVANGGLESDVGGLRPSGCQNWGIKAFGGAEGRALGGIVEDTRRGIAAVLEKELVDVPPAAGFIRVCVDFRVPAGVLILAFIDDHRIEGGPSFPEDGITGDFEDESGQIDFVERADGFP